MWHSILFDVGGVLAHQDTEAANRRLAALRPGLSVADVEAALVHPSSYPLWEQYSCGLLEGEVYWASVLEVLGLPQTPELIHTLRSIERDTWWAVVDQAVLELVRELRRQGRFRLGLLSNSAPEHEPHIATFAGLFEVMHFSHQTGLRKPWPAAFRAAAQALGAPPEAVVFIDDKARNVRAAEEVGMHGLHFQSASQLAPALVALRVLRLPRRGRGS